MIMLKTMANKNAGDSSEDDAENDGDDLAEVVKLMLKNNADNDDGRCNTDKAGDHFDRIAEKEVVEKICDNVLHENVQNDENHDVNNV
jgi:hypothetical protein